MTALRIIVICLFVIFGLTTATTSTTSTAGSTTTGQTTNSGATDLVNENLEEVSEEAASGSFSPLHTGGGYSAFIVAFLLSIYYAWKCIAWM